MQNSSVLSAQNGQERERFSHFNPIFRYPNSPIWLFFLVLASVSSLDKFLSAILCTCMLLSLEATTETPHISTPAHVYTGVVQARTFNESHMDSHDFYRQICIGFCKPLINDVSECTLWNLSWSLS